MNKSSKTTNSAEADFFLDITPEVCPMTFVRTKLMIEKMSKGDVAEVRLQGGEALRNVPRSVEDMGNSIVSLKPESITNGRHGIHRLLIRKG
jgi:TusA-related sulfurtransferase